MGANTFVVTLRTAFVKFQLLLIEAELERSIGASKLAKVRKV